MAFLCLQPAVNCGDLSPRHLGAHLEPSVLVQMLEYTFGSLTVYKYVSFSL